MVDVIQPKICREEAIASVVGFENIGGVDYKCTSWYSVDIILDSRIHNRWWPERFVFF